MLSFQSLELAYNQRNWYIYFLSITFWMGFISDQTKIASTPWTQQVWITTATATSLGIPPAGKPCMVVDWMCQLQGWSTIAFERLHQGDSCVQKAREQKPQRVFSVGKEMGICLCSWKENRVRQGVARWYILRLMEPILHLLKCLRQCNW